MADRISTHDQETEAKRQSDTAKMDKQQVDEAGKAFKNWLIVGAENLKKNKKGDK